VVFVDPTLAVDFGDDGIAPGNRGDGVRGHSCGSWSMVHAGAAVKRFPACWGSPRDYQFERTDCSTGML
jgi:hypothetical protein